MITEEQTNTTYKFGMQVQITVWNLRAQRNIGKRRGLTRI